VERRSIGKGVAKKNEKKKSREKKIIDKVVENQGEARYDSKRKKGRRPRRGNRWHKGGEKSNRSKAEETRKEKIKKEGHAKPKLWHATRTILLGPQGGILIRKRKKIGED